MTGMTVEETDTGTELAQCRLRPTSGVWVLEAILGMNADADVRCEVHCYTN